MWAYNLRNCDYASDSGSESNSPAASTDARGEVVSEDKKLLHDLDLSTRQDDAVYKPTPWTIAKLNAAARPAQAPVEKKPIPPGPKKQPAGRIVDSFKTQAMRRQNSRAALKPQRFRRMPSLKSSQDRPIQSRKPATMQSAAQTSKPCSDQSSPSYEAARSGARSSDCSASARQGPSAQPTTHIPTFSDLEAQALDSVSYPGSNARPGSDLSSDSTLFDVPTQHSPKPYLVEKVYMNSSQAHNAHNSKRTSATLGSDGTNMTGVLHCLMASLRFENS